MANPSVITVADVRALLRAGLAAVRGQGETPALVVLPKAAAPLVVPPAAPVEVEEQPARGAGKPAVKRAPARRKKASAP